MDPACVLYLQRVPSFKLTTSPSCHNESVLACALPTELLARIFVFLFEIQPHRTTVRSYVFHRSGGWASVMLVCSRWRAVALATASLWASVSLGGREPLDIFLQRSRSFLLSVCGVLGTNKATFNQRALQLLASAHHSRLAALEVEVKHESLGPAGDAESDVVVGILSAQDAHFPNFKELWIKHPTLTQCLPRTFFASQAPHLRKLTLEQYGFPWGVGSSTLQTLKLETEYTNDHPYTLENVLDSLASMPNLASLHTTNVLPDLYTDKHRFIKCHTVLHMPHLRSMWMLEHNSSFWVLCALIEARDLDFRIDVETPSPVELIVEALSRHVRLCKPSPFETLAFGQSEDGSHGAVGPFHLALYTTEPPEINLRMHFPLSAPSILQILRVFPVKQIRVLAVDGPYLKFSLDEIAEFFGSCTLLRELELHGTPPTAAFSSLLSLPPLHSDELDLSSQVPFPNLVEVRITRADLVSIPQAATLPLSTRLQNALSIRHEANRPLTLMKLMRCQVQENWVQYCRTLVHEVDWDGNSVWEDADEEDDSLL